MKHRFGSFRVGLLGLLVATPLLAQENGPPADSAAAADETPSVDAPFIFASVSPAASIRTKPEAGQADPLGLALVGAAGISHPRWSLGLQFGAIHTTVPTVDFGDIGSGEGVASFFREATSLAVGGSGRVTVVEFAEAPETAVVDLPSGAFADCIGFCPKATGIFLSGTIVNYWVGGSEASEEGFATSEGWVDLGLDAALHKRAEVRGTVGVGYNDRLDRLFESTPFRGRFAALLSVRLNSTVAVIGTFSTNFAWSDGERVTRDMSMAEPEAESSFTIGISLLQRWLLQEDEPS